MLVSPGLEITVTDESQYVSTAVGTVPFVLLATAENKIFNGSIAPYTAKINSNRLLAVTSQRDLITNFGYPTFKSSAAGTPLHGNELNEYGLMAAYSALGSVNRMYIIRADIDLAQLEGTAVRPIGNPVNGTYWLDLNKTAWGFQVWNAASQAFTAITPTVLTSASQVFNNAGILTPLQTIGRVGTYAVVAVSNNNYLFYKRSDNVWARVGSAEWQQAYATVTGTVVNPTITPGSQLIINNGAAITISGTDVYTAASTINSAAIPGVNAAAVNGRLALYVTSASQSNGVTADGKISLVDGTLAPLAAMGVAIGTFAGPTIAYSSYINIPDWRATDGTPRPSGSVWAKTSVLGNGAEFAFKQYNEINDAWTPVAATVYNSEREALYALDPNAGGFGIAAGTVVVLDDLLGDGTVTYKPFFRSVQGKTVVSGTPMVSSAPFTAGDSFTIRATQTGKSTFNVATITVNGTSKDDFVTAVLAANLPEVDISVSASNVITFTHRAGGLIRLANIAGTALAAAGFTSATPGVRVGPTGELTLSNFSALIYTYSTSQPYTAPIDGTLWFNNSPLDVDIMINETAGWKGYRNVSNDARGFNLVNTDPAGPIMAPLAPTTQSDSTALAAGDLWINTGDLENFPVISRYNGNKWVLLDNTDVVSQNGVAFADARWDTSGTADPVAGAMPAIADMLTSDYTDLDAPDHRLYPRGTLLFNLRRTGFNVKQYVHNYFNADAFPNAVSLPTQKATWVTASGLQNNKAPYMGHKAQRVMVVKALRAAIDGNDTVREESFGFNLQVTPGYPELISNMVALNNDRKNTGFVIGDTPMTLPAKVMDVTAWSTNSTGNGLSTADPYMAVYYPSGLANDLQGNTIVVPASHMILRTAIKSDNVSYPWFAYAGTRRGLIDNSTDIGYVDSKSGAFIRNGINQGMRDALYTLNINPLTLLPGVGLTNFGNKTRSGVASAMDRVNVARLVNYIRTILSHVGDGFLFEPNDAITRNQIKQVISSALNDLIAKRGVYDYLVICDESNNDNGRIARNELYVDVAIEPMKDVEFIYIPIRLKNPGGIKSSGK
jgi:hypothetical protein